MMSPPIVIMHVSLCVFLGAGEEAKLGRESIDQCCGAMIVKVKKQINNLWSRCCKREAVQREPSKLCQRLAFITSSTETNGPVRKTKTDYDK